MSFYVILLLLFASILCYGAKRFSSELVTWLTLAAILFVLFWAVIDRLSQFAF